MPISVTCKACQNSVKVKDTLAGKSFKCPNCTTVVRVPAPGASTGRPASQPARDALSEQEERRPRRRGPVEDDLDVVEDDRRRGEGGQSLSIDHDVPEHLQEQVAEELSRGEKLIWVGQPNRRVVLLRSLAVAGGAFVMFVIILVVMLVAMGPQGGMFLVPIALMGVLTVGSCLFPFYKLWRAGKTCYAITSRRAIVWRSTWFGSVEIDNYNPAQLTNMRRMNSWFIGGAGDLVFRSVTTITLRTGKHGGVSESTTYYGFLDLENVRDVEKLLRESLVDRFVDKLTE